MTAPRPIRPIDGNALLDELMKVIGDVLSPGERSMANTVIRWIKAAPTLPQPEPVAGAADGDAVSREAVIDIAKRFGYVTIPEMIKAIGDLPSIPATPALDVVTVEDVVVGIEWMDREKSERHRIVRSAGDWADVAYGGFLAGDGEHTFSKKAVAAMLNVAETIGWPDSHRRSPKHKSIDDQIDEVGDLYNRGQLGAQDAFSKIYELAKKAVEATK